MMPAEFIMRSMNKLYEKIGKIMSNYWLKLMEMALSSEDSILPSICFTNCSNNMAL